MRTNGTSRNLRDRLSVGFPSELPTVSKYVDSVRVHVSACKNSGSQQHRLRYKEECWLVSQDRWITEQRAAAGSWDSIIRVLQSCLDEAVAQRDLEEHPTAISPDAFVRELQAEQAADHQEEVATTEALHRRTPTAYRRVVDLASIKINAIRRKARMAAALATTHRSA